MNCTESQISPLNKSLLDFACTPSIHYVWESFIIYLQTCGNKLVGVCKSEEEVTKEKDDQLKVALVKVRETIPNWDSDKCPAMK